LLIVHWTPMGDELMERWMDRLSRPIYDLSIKVTENSKGNDE